jgi:hypothetical protein
VWSVLHIQVPYVGRVVSPPTGLDIVSLYERRAGAGKSPCSFSSPLTLTHCCFPVSRAQASDTWRWEYVDRYAKEPESEVLFGCGMVLWHPVVLLRWCFFFCFFFFFLKVIPGRLPHIAIQLCSVGFKSASCPSNTCSIPSQSAASGVEDMQALSKVLQV